MIEFVYFCEVNSMKVTIKDETKCEREKEHVFFNDDNNIVLLLL